MAMAKLGGNEQLTHGGRVAGVSRRDRRRKGPEGAA